MSSPSHDHSHRRMLAIHSRIACLAGAFFIAFAICAVIGVRAYGEPQGQVQTQEPDQSQGQFQDQDPTQDQDQFQDPSQGQGSIQAQPATPSASDAPDDDDIRILEAISFQLDDIRVRMAPLGTPKSQWPISVESYIQQAKRGSWPGADSRWPTDGSFDDPRTLVAICRECEDYINGQTSEHWETDGILHPYGYGIYGVHLDLQYLPLDMETGLIVEMVAESDDWGHAYSAVLWRGGAPAKYGPTSLLAERLPEREDSQLTDGMTEAEVAKEIRTALTADVVMAGRRFDVPAPSYGMFRVHVFEGEDDKRLGYPLRTEEGLLALVASLGDALPSNTKIIVSSVDGKKDVVGYCVSTCDHSEQPVAELTVERYANKKEAEDALNMPFAVPEELNGRKPYAWDIALTRSRDNHDLGAVPRTIAIVRYGSPSDVEGVVVMGDFLLNPVCDEMFENEDWGDFRYVDVRGNRIGLHECDHSFKADWYSDSNIGRTCSYLLVAKRPVDADSDALDNYARRIHAQTYLGSSEVEKVELPMSAKAVLFGLLLVAYMVLTFLL